MNYFFILFMFLNVFARSESYHGPQEAGIESFSCGTYKVKGKLNRMIINKEKSIYSLNVYTETTREYRMRVSGEELRKYDSFSEAPFIEVEGVIKSKALGDQAHLFLTKEPRLTTELKALENTVELVNPSNCN
jgi:hypothetical protein